MRKRLITALLGVLLSATAQATDGMVNIKSLHSVADTTDKLETVLRTKGMTVFIRIDHRAGAEQAGMSLRDTQLVIFGNPKVGTPLMNCSQSVAIDLPQKALIWEDQQGQVWLSYNDPAYLAGRHAIKGCEEVLNKVSGVLANFSKAATE